MKNVDVHRFSVDVCQISVPLRAKDVDVHRISVDVRQTSVQLRVRVKDADVKLSVQMHVVLTFETAFSSSA